jgi:hypothetical protein
MRGVERGQADVVDIGVGAAPVFRRHGMGARKLVLTCTGRSRNARAARSIFKFGLDVEPVAGLDLDRGDAFGDQRVDAGSAPASSSASLMRPGGRTVETMPPPARAISS